MGPRYEPTRILSVIFPTTQDFEINDAFSEIDLIVEKNNQ
jgi:hypothetical protein